MTIKTMLFDASKYLDSEAAIAEYINAAMAEDDSALFMAALSNVIKARGITKVARDAGIGRESLYKTLAPGAAPRFDTVMKLMHALGITLTTAPTKVDAAHV